MFFHLFTLLLLELNAAAIIIIGFFFFFIMFDCIFSFLFLGCVWFTHFSLNSIKRQQFGILFFLFIWISSSLRVCVV